MNLPHLKFEVGLIRVSDVAICTSCISQSLSPEKSVYSPTFHGSSSHLDEALDHFNLAADMLQDGWRTKMEIARTLFDGLNKIQTDWLQSPSGDRWLHGQATDAGKTPGEVKTFKAMVLDMISPADKIALFNSRELKQLVEFDPPIMDHHVLNRHGYRPDQPIDAAIQHKATEMHRRLRGSLQDLQNARNAEIIDRTINRTAELLYIVRSNINHGEKTAYGSDAGKRKRDEAVAAVVVPLQLLLVDLMLDRPSRRLVVYGTLAPGAANHEILAGVSGQWQDCRLNGKIIDSNGLPALSLAPGSTLDAKLFVSGELPTHWQRIDCFEGSRYRRRLVLARRNDEATVAYAYVGNA